jgi:large repetitive protein
VSNSGNQDAGAVRVTETVPPLAHFSAAASTPGWTCAPNGNPGATCTFDLPALPAGTSQEIVFALRADDPLPASATIRNAACAEIPDSGLTSCATVETPPALSLASTLSVDLLTDADSSGGASAGDTLRYTLKLPNATTVALLALTARPEIDPFTQLVAGSVTTDHGTVTDGNGPSDTFVFVAVGDLAPGATATVTFDVRIASSLPAGLLQVSAQALSRGANIPDDASDDPATPEPDDPTVTRLSTGGSPRVKEVPTLGFVGLAVLGLSILGAGATMLRR